MWSTNRRHLFLSPFVAVVTLLLAHFCCFGPFLIVPLGLEGVNSLVSNITYLNYGFSVIAVFILGYNGWKIYSQRKVNKIVKVSYWFSVLLVFYVFIKNFI